MHSHGLLALLALALAFAAPAGAAFPAADEPVGAPPPLDAAGAGRFARLALACVHQEYPNKIAHVLRSGDDVRAPHELYPAFYGCFDWHSSVHGHWLLARLARLYPDAPFAAPARAALAEDLQPAKIAAEAAYLAGEGRASFERPYGLAWLLQLAAELREWNDPDAQRWAAALTPLEDAAVARLSSWLPKLAYPIRIGEHDQTAFALGLVRDWAVTAGNAGLRDLVDGTARRLYGADRACPLAYEPSGQDFLSPCLAEADLLRRVLPQPEFATWLAGFLPQIPGTPGGASPAAAATGWLPVGIVTDRADPKLAHLDGLNLSRAWMLMGIASALPAGDPRLPALGAAARAHADEALPAVTGEHYEGGHWLGSFATYLTTRRGLVSSPAASPLKE